MQGADSQTSRRFDLQDAAAADAASLADLNTSCWRAAYVDILPPTPLGELDVAARKERLRARLAEADAPQLTLVVGAGRRSLRLVANGPVRAEPPASARNPRSLPRP